MEIDRSIARISRALVDQSGISVFDAEKKLRNMRLDVVVGDIEPTAAAHAAILTSISVGSRSFPGGVRLILEKNDDLRVPWVDGRKTLGDAANSLLPGGFEGEASQTLAFGRLNQGNETGLIHPTWSEWEAGWTHASDDRLNQGQNPLSGIAAAALAVGAAFNSEMGNDTGGTCLKSLWPDNPPHFSNTFLPASLWLVGLGNLGQAYLWALSMLPFRDRSSITYYLQDDDRVSDENWGTSVLVQPNMVGSLKTKVAETWLEARGFRLIHRLDRRLHGADAIRPTEPKVALSGLDKIAGRKALAAVGFDIIVDAGLGRTAADFDRYRVSVFDNGNPIDEHFAALKDEKPRERENLPEAYRELEKEIGACGMAEYAGASVAAPFVSAYTAACAVSRLIAVSSGLAFPANEVGRMSRIGPSKCTPKRNANARGISHAGKPDLPR